MAHKKHKWNLEYMTMSHRCTKCYAQVTYQQVGRCPTYKDLDKIWQDYKTIGINGYRLTTANPENTERLYWMVEVV